MKKTMNEKLMDAYDEKQENVDVLRKLINEKLSDMMNLSKPTWGLVGDLDHAEELLKELNDFLTYKHNK